MNAEEIRQTFLEQLEQDRPQIERAWKRLTAGEPGASEALIGLIHRLSGSALSVGYGEIGAAARQMELALRKAGALPDWQILQPGYDRLIEAIEACRPDAAAALDPAQAAEADADGDPLAGLIYIVEDDLTQAESLASQIVRFGYRVQTFARFDELRRALRQKIPTVILMDIVFPEGDLAGTEEMLRLRGEFGEQLPVYFISVRDDVVARIKAIRAGAKGYYLKPVDIDALVDDINKLTMSIDPQRYRVLIVDDSEIQAKTNALHLRKANIETLALSQPEEVLEQIKNFRPDLILLDLYLPDFNGLELAQMIRQIKTHVILPIVYLSSETDREKQLEAVGQGGDDFLTKPIKPDQLIASVTARIERYRQLQALMVRDGLTSLYNHTTMREYLAQEASRAQRTGEPFSVAMIDIDNFKNVNDAHGHATGDKVLRSLALMFTRRLRRSDIIGRYGGEEFMIIFPNTGKAAAAALMDELRESFAQIVHVADGREFSVTFSCGIAAYPEAPGSPELSEAADRALYTAKRLGRNRVVTAKP